MEKVTLQQAMKAMSGGDFSTAESMLERLVGQEPANLAAWLNLAAVRRQRERLDLAFEALHSALRLDNRNFPALLMQATLHERLGQELQAADAFGVALAQAPPDSALDPVTLKVVERARTLHARHVARMREFIRERSLDALIDCRPALRHRLDAFIDSTLRVRPRYQQEPSDYWYPGLPAIEFYEREEFPWLPDLEAATEVIRVELLEVLRVDNGSFSPYIHYPDHAPLEQWRELNHSPKWTSYNFFEAGTLMPERCARAPQTMRALSKLPMPHVSGRSPTAVFSHLLPHTRIPPHNGAANFRLLVHLPLVLPNNCGFRVGSQVREWRMGEAWVFDDTIEHEAWNASEEMRTILICDIWNPRLAEDERRAIAHVVAASDEFRGLQPGSTT